MSKGSERKRSGSRRKPAGAGRAQPKPPHTDPEAGPSLAWAKWVEALGSDSPEEDPPDTPRAAEERLRAATLAAERARQMREMARAAETDSPAVAAPGRRAVTAPPAAPPTPPSPPVSPPPAARAVAPPRHDPERIPAPETSFRFTAAPDTTLARTLAPASLAAPTSSSTEQLRDEPLPPRYHDDRITLLCRDPHWLHTYWEITAANLERARGMLATPASLILRVHHFPALTGGAAASFDVELQPEARNWYVHGGHPGHDFEVEIGLRSSDGRFIGLARSNRVQAPLDRSSDVLDEEWRNLAGDDERLYRLSGGYERASGASGEMPELVARRELLGSGAVSSFGGAVAPARRGFWFTLDTEIVVYGATEPGASVTCQGRQVPLRADGTFTLRFALPEGTQHIDCAALAADRSATITITPAVDKRTAREERRQEDQQGD